MPGITPDARHGEMFEDEGIILADTSEPTAPGELRYYGGAFRAMDGLGVFGLRGGGGGITEDQHKILRQLIHFVDEGPAEGFTSGAYKETTPTGPFPTSMIWWESAAKLKKIVERTVTWTGAFPTTDVWKVYAADGSTVLATVSDAISYSGAFETTRTRTITVP